MSWKQPRPVKDTRPATTPFEDVELPLDPSWPSKLRWKKVGSCHNIIWDLVEVCGLDAWKWSSALGPLKTSADTFNEDDRAGVAQPAEAVDGYGTKLRVFGTREAIQDFKNQLDKLSTLNLNKWLLSKNVALQDEPEQLNLRPKSTLFMSSSIGPSAVLEDNKAVVEDMAKKVFFGEEKVDTSKFIERCYVRLLQASLADYGIPTDWTTQGKAGEAIKLCNEWCDGCKRYHFTKTRFSKHLMQAENIRCRELCKQKNVDTLSQLGEGPNMYETFTNRGEGKPAGSTALNCWAQQQMAEFTPAKLRALENNLHPQRDGDNNVSNEEPTEEFHDAADVLSVAGTDVSTVAASVGAASCFTSFSRATSQMTYKPTRHLVERQELRGIQKQEIQFTKKHGEKRTTIDPYTGAVTEMYNGNGVTVVTQRSRDGATHDLTTYRPSYAVDAQPKDAPQPNAPNAGPTRKDAERPKERVWWSASSWLDGGVGKADPELTSSPRQETSEHQAEQSTYDDEIESMLPGLSIAGKIAGLHVFSAGTWLQALQATCTSDTDEHNPRESPNAARSIPEQKSGDHDHLPTTESMLPEQVISMLETRLLKSESGRRRDQESFNELQEAWRRQSITFERNLMMHMSWQKAAIYEASLMQAKMNEAEVEKKRLREEVLRLTQDKEALTHEAAKYRAECTQMKAVAQFQLQQHSDARKLWEATSQRMQAVDAELCELKVQVKSQLNK